MDRNETLPIFARRVTQVREQRGWSQQELAERAETSYQTIWRIERGIHKEPGIYLAGTHCPCPTHEPGFSLRSL